MKLKGRFGSKLEKGVLAAVVGGCIRRMMSERRSFCGSGCVMERVQQGLVAGDQSLVVTA
jgi:hypothetical protein